jgi:hypothetical protein
MNSACRPDTNGGFKTWIAIVCCVFILNGCGGSGGDGDSNGKNANLGPTNLPPVAEAGQDLFTYDSRLITLTGTSTDADGTIVSHQWSQIGGFGVFLDGATTSTARFTAPPTTGALVFQYTVTDNDGAQQSDTVSVYVSKILFSDTFDDTSSLSNWNIVDDAGNPSTWQVLLGGGFFQQNNVDFDAFVGSYHIGTFAYLDESVFTRTSKFRVSVDIMPMKNNNGETEGNDVGIMFPYAAVDNYYRLTMNSRYGFTRLEKRNGTSFRTLAVNSIGYIDGQPMNLTVEVNTDTIIVSVNDDPVFAESNLSISPGTIALYCQDKTIFDQVVVSDNSPQPMIAVSSPLAYSIALTPSDEDALFAQAVVLNKPVGSSVAFTLDGESETVSTESGNLFSTQFLSVADGEHELTAILRNSEGDELIRDININVGVGGNYIIAAGDSIVNGFGDEDSTNNESADGRIVSIQGFTAPLNDLLTTTFANYFTNRNYIPKKG